MEFANALMFLTRTARKSIQKGGESVEWEDCPTCNGYYLNMETGEFIRTRETRGGVCENCGHDYFSEDKEPPGDTKS